MISKVKKVLTKIFLLGKMYELGGIKSLKNKLVNLASITETKVFLFFRVFSVANSTRNTFSIKKEVGANVRTTFASTSTSHAIQIIPGYLWLGKVFPKITLYILYFFSSKALSFFSCGEKIPINAVPTSGQFFNFFDYFIILISLFCNKMVRLS